MTAIDQFRQEIAAAKLPMPEVIYADGKIHRFSTNGKPSDDSGWYVFHDDGIPAGSFGCWRDGQSQNWSAKATNDMTPAERDAHRARMQAMQAQREADTAQRQQRAAEEAAQRWAQSTPATGNAYLATKGVKTHGVKAERDGLLVPMRDVTGALCSLQFITPEGGKYFHTGGRVKGCYHAIGKPAGVLVIAERYATGASIHEATGHAVAVAFNAGNVPEVAKALRQKYPSMRLVVAADDDHKTDGNPGLTKAKEAAQAVGGTLAVPRFTAARGDGDTDFNDLAQHEGLAAVAACIAAAAEPVASTPTFPPLEEGDALPAAKLSQVVLTCGTDLQPEPVRWLWDGWLALGKLHILAGAPGQGKTTLALAMAATVTRGGRWPDDTRCMSGNILIWSGEDDPADTLLPRLLASDADRSNCFFIEGARDENGEVQPFDPARDLPGLAKEIERIGGVRLLVVDPVVSAVTGDSHKNTEVRRALQPLVNLAAACDCAVLGITHFTKGGQGADPAQRVVGSVAFTAVARVVMVAAKVKSPDEGEDMRILARGKSNIGPDDGGFEYHLEQAEPLPGIHASHIAWGQPVEGSARELLSDPHGDDLDEEAQDAVKFLRSLLADGPMPAKAIYKDADGAGFSRDQIKRASTKLGVEKRKEGMAGGWVWALTTAEGSMKSAKSARFKNTLPSHSSVLPSGENADQADMEVI